MPLTAIILSMRPSQWVKNVIVFAALIFAQHLYHPLYIFKSIAAFILFCGAAGSIYIFNDLVDREKDKFHPVNSKRPLASGKLTVSAAAAASVIIALFSLSGSFMLSFSFGFIILIYIILNIVYSLKIKTIVILDIFSIAFGFALRAVGGALAINVIISNWLLACTILLSLFLALGKRRAEIVLLKKNVEQFRKTLAEYSPELLDQMISIVTSATVVSYILYTLSSETVEKFQTTNLKYTIPFVLYGIFRYLYLIYQGNQGGRPERVLLTDIPLIINIVCYIIAVSFVLY